MTITVDELQSFGRRLAAARNDTGLTLDATAKALEARGIACTKQAVSAWENGRNMPSPLVLKRLCTLYGCTADSLLWDSPADVPGANLAMTPAYLAKLAALQPAQVEHIRRQVELAVDSFHLTAAPRMKRPADVLTLPCRRRAPIHRTVDHPSAQVLAFPFTRE